MRRLVGWHPADVASRQRSPHESRIHKTVERLAQSWRHFPIDENRCVTPVLRTHARTAAGRDGTAGTEPKLPTMRPEISVVIPCLNEAQAVGAVVDQALEGIARSGRPGEVIVIDNNSTDGSAEVARSHGATVVHESRPGYGSAYLTGLDLAQGDYIVMGDADATYPLVALSPFVERLAAGDDLVMGSRFRGTIHGEAMPWLNRHVGNPILTGLLNVLFKVKISDAHCGMRAVRRAALPTLDLHSTGMEFASEMVFKAYRRGLTVSELPIDYYPRVGESKLNRFADAWRHVRFMLLYSPSWLYFVPGVILLSLGLAGTIALATGPVNVLGRTWQIHTLFACIAAVLLGTQVVQLGVFSRTFARLHLGERDPLLDRLRERIRLEHGILLGLSLMLGGAALVGTIFVLWALDGFGALSHEYSTAIGFTLVALGVQVLLGSFFMGLLTMRTRS